MNTFTIALTDPGWCYEKCRTLVFAPFFLSFFLLLFPLNLVSTVANFLSPITAGPGGALNLMSYL